MAAMMGCRQAEEGESPRRLRAVESQGGSEAHHSRRVNIAAALLFSRQPFLLGPSAEEDGEEGEEAEQDEPAEDGDAVVDEASLVRARADRRLTVYEQVRGCTTCIACDEWPIARLMGAA